MGDLAIRRIALIRPKVRPSASLTSRRRSLSSTRSHIADQARSAASAPDVFVRLPTYVDPLLLQELWVQFSSRSLRGPTGPIGRHHPAQYEDHESASRKDEPTRVGQQRHM